MREISVATYAASRAGLKQRTITSPNKVMILMNKMEIVWLLGDYVRSAAKTNSMMWQVVER